MLIFIRNALSYDEWRVYEFICRQFLASLSQDAEANEIKLEIKIGTETFTARGLTISKLGYLEVYNYESWNNLSLPSLNEGDKIKPEVVLSESSTSPPKLLSEADLISLMDKTGIGTDATIHEHIKTIQERGYCQKEHNHFLPTQIGVYLIEAYKAIGVELYKPYLRAQMEKDLNTIATGDKTKDQVVFSSLSEMLKIFNKVESSKDKMQDVLKKMVTKDHDREYERQVTDALMSLDQFADEYCEEKAEEDLPLNPINQNIQSSDRFTVMWICPKWNRSNVVIKKNKLTKENFLAWTGFPRWRESKNISPTILKFKAIKDSVCCDCTTLGRKNVPLFNIEFKKEIYNYEEAKAHLDTFKSANIWIWPDWDKNLVLLDGILRFLGAEKSVKPEFNPANKSYSNSKSNKFSNYNSGYSKFKTYSYKTH